MDSTYIFTEIIRCGQIGYHAIQSFHKYHNLPLHIWCSQDDVQHIPQHTNNHIHIIPKDSDAYTFFDSGHKGTSYLWTNLIYDLPAQYTHLLHFDSDVLFLGNILDQIVEDTKSYDLIGPARPYKNNPNNRDDIRHLPDVVQTYCFAFSRNKIQMPNKSILWDWVRGYPTQFPHPVIDYFDPVSFTILKNDGKIKYLDADVMGGVNTYGKRNNKHGELNQVFDVGDAIIHFASVGSGLNFCNMIQQNIQIQVPQSYVTFAIERFDIYSQLFFDKKVLHSTKNDTMVTKLKEYIHI